MSYTGDWHPGPLEDQAALLGVRVGVWNHMKYPEQVPAAGEHDAEAIKAAHGAIAVIDEIVRDLYKLREALAGEIRADEDAHMKRADELIAEAHARREAGQ